MDEATGAVIDDDVVGGVIGEKNDVAGAVAGEAMAVVDGRGGIKDAPAGNDAVAKLALAQDGRGGDDGRCLGSGGNDHASGDRTGGF